MGKTVLLLLERIKSGDSRDETDRVPSRINITKFDILLYIIGIGLFVVDLIVDINVCVRYAVESRLTEFYWTLAFLVIPLLINTAVSMAMYSQDKRTKTDPYDNRNIGANCGPNDEYDKWTSKKHTIRLVMLALQMTMMFRTVEALIYAVKSRKAGKKKDWDSQRKYYISMLNEDSDLALLKIFECFLEAAPQQVLQTSLLLKGFKNENLKLHQILSIMSSLLSMGWCLAAYQRSIRYVQEDKLNMNWAGSSLQMAWHFLVTLSRVISISIIATLYPKWTIVACSIHIMCMFLLVQIFDRSPFCSENKLGEVAFSLALGAIYLFTYILPKDGRTRYRYTGFYGLCFCENIACAVIWWLYSDVGLNPFYFYTVLVLSIVPFILGIICMVIYYTVLHPTLRIRS